MAYANNGAVRLYWRVDGASDRPALLLLNAIGTDLAIWDRSLPWLIPQFRVLRMDTRGHGASDVPAGEYRLEQLSHDALAVLDAAGVARATVCGISLGGMIALQLALAAPERLDALICACSSAQMDRDTWEARLQTVRSGGMAAVVDMAMQRFFSPAFTQAHPELIAGVRATLLGTSAEGYAGCGAAVRDMQLLAGLARIRAPTLVISGERDVSTPFDTHGRHLLAGIAARSTSASTQRIWPVTKRQARSQRRYANSALQPAATQGAMQASATRATRCLMRAWLYAARCSGMPGWSVRYGSALLSMPTTRRSSPALSGRRSGAGPAWISAPGACW
jgi:3-oxoadipate enol-lactonase/4-carboxymuconolactone decarboxylase